MDIKLLFVIGLFALFFILKAIRKEQTYFFLTIIMLAVRQLDVALIGAVTPTTIMILALFVGSLVKIRPYLEHHKLYLTILFLAFIIGAVNVTPFSKTFNWSIMLLNVILLATLCPCYIRNKEDMIKFIKCVLAVCFIFSITTIMGYYGIADGTVIYDGRNNISMEENIDIYHASRMYGIVFSNLVQIISVISICLIPVLRIKKRIVEWVIIGIFVYAALITIKRMTFIALILSLYFYIRSKIKTKDYTTITIILIMCVVMVSAWWEPIMHRFEIMNLTGEDDIEDSSTTSRFARIEYAIQAFKESPLFGMGAGYVIYIHNGFFEILANCGILGIYALFIKYIPNVKDIIKGNPWAVATLLFVLTCFSMEAALNVAQPLYFLGVFLGGYFASKTIAEE